MKIGNILLASSVAIIFSVGIAQAGPCNAANKDAGSGPTPGHNGQTTGAVPTRSDQHPPTSTMNRASGDVTTSPGDAQRQMQGQPTAAQGAKAKGADDGC